MRRCGPMLHVSQIASTVCLSVRKVSNKCIAVRKVATPLWELTCNIGSHSVTCRPAEVTFSPRACWKQGIAVQKRMNQSWACLGSRYAWVQGALCYMGHTIPWRQEALLRKSACLPRLMYLVLSVLGTVCLPRALSIRVHSSPRCLFV